MKTHYFDEPTGICVQYSLVVLKSVTVELILQLSIFCVKLFFEKYIARLSDCAALGCSPAAAL